MFFSSIIKIAGLPSGKGESDRKQKKNGKDSLAVAEEAEKSYNGLKEVRIVERLERRFGMRDFFKGLIFMFIIIYVISPADALPGPVDDILLVLFTMTARKRMFIKKYGSW